jgi:hypothetical protein
MAKFSDRIFGSNVDPDVLKKFKRLQSGIIEQKPNEPIVENQDYLGNRTTFARMWTASLITGSIEDKSGESNPFSEVNFHVVNDNRGESYKPNDPIGDGVFNELAGSEDNPGNPYLKPKAGITSISTKNEGSLGVIKNTTVEFVVHNKVDFESIFLPFFMKPGATVIVDYGWSDSFVNLYDVKEKVTKTDTELSQFKKFIYGGLNLEGVPPESINAIYQNPKSGEYYYWKDKDEKVPIKYDDGFLETNAGLVDTIVGVVKNFNATITQQGSFNCTIDLVSQNTTLLDQEITDENNLKFIFATQIEDTIVQILTGNNLTVNSKLKTINDTFNAKQKKLAINNFFEQTLRIDESELGVLPKSAVKLGFFYQNLTQGGTENNRDLLYMSFGRFEDLFLNSLIAKTRSKTGDTTVGQSTGKLDTNFNFRNVWVRFDDNLYNRQKQIIESNEALPVFLYPENWTKEKTSGPKFTPMRVTFKVDSDSFSSQDTDGLMGDDHDFWSSDDQPSFRVRESNNSLFIIDSENPWGTERLTLNHIIDELLSPAKDKSIFTGTLRSFSYYSSRELSKADIPTADEIIAANPNDLVKTGAKADTPLVDGTYAISFKVPIPEGKVVSADVIRDKSSVNDWKTKVIPLRNVFISVEEISKAFSTKQNINDAIDYLLERINKDSYDVLKLKMYSPNTLHSSISITDANLMPTQNLTDDMLIFDVTSGKSIVSDLSYNFQTPKGGFASMIAIGDKTGTKLFDEQTKDTLNFLKVLEINKFTETPDKVYYKSLPLNTRDETKRTTEIEFDFGSIAAHDVETAANELENTKNLATSFVDIVNTIQTKEKEENKGKSPTAKNTSLEKQDKDKDNFLLSNSIRDYYGKQARLNLIYSGQDSSISPILPIELSLTVYGNTYLNNGDIFNINFLPKSYSKRVYFQIVGVEQKLQPAGWTTSYTTIMRVNPNAKKEAVDDDRRISFSKVFIKAKLQEYDKQFVYNLPEVVESSVPVNNLPNGYTGYKINTDYSVYTGDQLKSYDIEKRKDSRLLQNSFKRVSNQFDFLYIYAMNQTIWEYLNNEEGIHPFKLSPDKTSVGIYLLNDELKNTHNWELKNFDHDVNFFVAVRTSKDFTPQGNPQFSLLQHGPNRPQTPKLYLEDTIKKYKTIISGFSKLVKKQLSASAPKHGFWLYENSPITQAKIVDEYGSIIKGFNFKLNDYDNGKASFYLIKTPSEIQCINSLRLPDWFVDMGFIHNLNKNYKKLLDQTQKTPIADAWVKGKIEDTKIGGISFSPLRG